MAYVLVLLLTCMLACTQAKSSSLRGLSTSTATSCAAFGDWPSVDNWITCGNCRALVLTAPYGGRCDSYCQSFGHVCIAAAEEVNENCEVKQTVLCTQEIPNTSDMLCTCHAAVPVGSCDTQCKVNGATHTCRDRVDWLQDHQQRPLSDALRVVNEECGAQCSCSANDFDAQTTTSTTQYSSTWASTADLCDAKCEVNGETHPCRDRVSYLQEYQHRTLSDALQVVNQECDAQCSCDTDDFAGQTSTTPADTSLILKVMSYNTEYRGYPGRVSQYGNKIRGVGAAVVGTQECQDKNALRDASGYQLVPDTDFQNPIFYDAAQVSLVAGSGGWMSIQRDDYATRTITWAKFRLGNSDFLFFNTHLPHNHNQAWSKNTHAQIAQSLLQKRSELGAADMPTVITGDCNPFASAGASQGSFESNLIAAGFHKSYEGRGNPGYGGLDKIFASSHWASSNGADQGTGGSDHPAIAVDLTLNR